MMKKDILKRPKTIRLNFADRDPSNKFLYLVYRVLRILHVAVWFYSLPFLFLIMMYYYPILSLVAEFEANNADAPNPSEVDLPTGD